MLPRIKKPRQPIYLDHAATTPIDPRVKKAMDPFFSAHFGNPSSLYSIGREAHEAIEKARKNISNIISAKPQEIIFTAGGTESINLAIMGVARDYLSLLKQGKVPMPHLITSAIEHHAVLHSFQALEKEGFQTSYINVDRDGIILLEELKSSIKPETIFISIMHANNEIGSIQPIAEIGKLVKQINTDRIQHGLTPILFHTDACQTAGALEINVQKMGVDLLSVNGSKIYGPKQIGFLYIKSGTPIQPIVYGGGQERNLRSGTENVPSVVGLAEAFSYAQKGRVKENTKNRKLRDYFITQLLKRIPEAKLNGPDERKFKVIDNNQIRLSNNINISFNGVEGEALMLYLDSYGICVSTGSACTTGEADPSHVLMAIGQTEQQAKSAIRMTLGKQNTKQEIDFALKVIPGVVNELRRVTK
jgi:cysteine desulfurase